MVEENWGRGLAPENHWAFWVTKIGKIKETTIMYGEGEKYEPRREMGVEGEGRCSKESFESRKTSRKKSAGTPHH